MSEFEEIDGKLKIICDHEWNKGMSGGTSTRQRLFGKPKHDSRITYKKCTKCNEVVILEYKDLK